MAKRRYLSQLPAVLQTQTLQKFFSATVDQVFQPGVTQSLNAFIGRKPTYFDPSRDFYKTEFDASRSFYQLEPAMTSSADTPSQFSDLLFYEDLVNSLRFQGADVSNHSRLFETDMYSWCPPINVHKLVNYREYYWLPDGPPTLVLDIPVGGANAMYVADGTKSRFAIPYSTVTMPEDLVVKIDGLTLDNSQFTKIGTDVVLINYDAQTGSQIEVPANQGAVVQIWINGAYLADGIRKSFPLPPVVQTAHYSPIVYLSGVQQNPDSYVVDRFNIIFNVAPAAGLSVKIWVNPNFAQNINGKDQYSHTVAAKAYASQSQVNELTGTRQVINFPETIINTPPALERGFRVEIRDNLGSNFYKVDRDVNGKLFLNTDRNEVIRYEPLHTCIERDARMQSLWSRANHWYHKSTMFFFANNYTPATAQRPIIEFTQDIKLNNYGFNRLPDVDVIVDSIAENPWQFQGANSASSNSLNDIPQVTIDGNTVDLPTGRVLFRKVVDASPLHHSVDNQILDIHLRSSSTGLPEEVIAYDSELLTFAYVASNEQVDAQGNYTGHHTAANYVGKGSDLGVWSNYDNDGWDTDYVVEISQRSVSSQFDVFKLTGEMKEYWYFGPNWVPTQEFGGTFEPLFDLYDGDSLETTGIPTALLGDQIKYPGNKFLGNKIFSFSRGTGAPDSVLGFSIKRNKFGNIEFTDNLNDPVTFNNGSIDSFKYFARIAVANKNADFDITQATYDDSQVLINSEITVDIKYGNSWQPAGSSTQALASGGFYDIPSNLQGNPLNENINAISINDWNAHWKPVLSGNNWNLKSNTFDLSLGRKILQHRSPLLRTMFMNSKSSVDFIKSSIYSEREYVRYCNKFKQALTKMAQSGQISNINTALTTILKQLKLAKTVDFPFSNNNMGGGDWYIPSTGAALGLTPSWKPELIVEQSRSKNSQILMVRGHDGSLTPGFTRGSQDEPITEQNYDIRDLVTLAFEQLLYDNINAQLKAQRRPLFDLTAYKPGKYRNSEYTRDEFISVARPIFERWASQSQFNYRENNGFDDSNAWTFNYQTTVDKDGAAIPGNWRGIYNWYFDTDRPHTHPWEMLGFTSKPATWDNYYSWIDTSKRAALIAAIVSGVIDPVNKTVDLAYARPDFAYVNPVSLSGNLLDPIEAKIVIDTGYLKFNSPWEFGDMGPVEYTWWTSHLTSFSKSQLSYLLKPARFVESNWLALSETLVHGNQWVNSATGLREYDSGSTVHNEIVNGVPVRKIGIQTWISDYIKSQGLSITTAMGNSIRTLGVSLAHKLGGFIDAASLKAFTENSGLIPQEDVLTALYRSPSVREEFYGGVITEWTGSGWKLMGYNMVDPVFKILEPRQTGRKAKIALTDAVDAPVDWKPNTYFMVGVLAYYQGTNYRCVKTHTSGTKFEENYWNAESVGRVDNAAQVVWYFDHNTEEVRIPYGTVLTTKQDVAEFLSGYQAYLASKGWSFDNYDNEINETKDFRYSAREFLYWTQTRWAEGSFITLSPLATGVTFKTTHGTIQNVDQLVNGCYSIVDRAGMAIAPSNVTVNRFDDVITVGVIEGGIFGLRLYVSEIEQVVVFRNNTIFGDVLYDPRFDLRQSRIRLLVNISQDWAGRLDAPGFVITDNKLVPSFDTQVEDIRYMYDIEKAINLPLRDNARHQIGYQSRPYLENLMYNEVNQFEFYQGAIKQKGTPGVFGKLLRNNGLTATSSLNFLEEWAFRNGEYGAVDKNSIFEFVLNKNEVKTEPQQIEFVDYSSGWDISPYENVDDPLALVWDSATPAILQSFDALDDTIIRLYEYNGVYDPRWVTPKTTQAFPTEVDFTRVKSALPSAGYARVYDTKFQALTAQEISAQVANSNVDLGIGDRVWIYKNEKSNWGIYRASSPHITANQIHSSVFTSRLQLNDQGQDVTLATTTNKEVNAYRLLVSGLVGIAQGDIIEVLDDKIPALGIQGVFEVTQASIGEWIEVKHQASEVVAYSQNGLTTRVTLGAKHNLKVGDAIYITKEVYVDQPLLAGMHVITSLDEFDETVVYVDAEVTSDHSYWVNSDKPNLYLMANMRFSSNLVADENRVNSLSNADLVEFNNVIDINQLVNGELVYVDVCYDIEFQDFLAKHKRRWAVYEKTANGLSLLRKQPTKVRRDLINDIKLFETTSIRTNQTLNAKPLINSDIIVLDPSQGLVPGVAQKEIQYKLDYDPASYNVGPDGDQGNEWGQPEVGMLWWDLSTTRYLVSETDDIVNNIDDVDVSASEKIYRAATWGKLAPNTSVDIYEWTKSSITPLEWQAIYDTGTNVQNYDGPVYGGQYGDYVESTEWDRNLSKFVPVYFFWVKNRIYTPGNMPSRQVPAKIVSAMLSNPGAQGISWVSPLTSNSLITSGLTQYLTVTSSMQFTVAKTDSDTSRHVQWEIMRKGDDRSLPQGELWAKMATSLAARDVWGNAVPDVNRYYTDRIGFDVEHGQNLFKDVKSARKHLVQYLNSVFSKSLFSDERRDLAILNVSEGQTNNLNWAQKTDSHYIQPIPHRKLWNSLVDRLTAIKETQRYVDPITHQYTETLGDFALRLSNWKFTNNSAIHSGAVYEYDTTKPQLIRNLRLSEAYWTVLQQELWDGPNQFTPWDQTQTDPQHPAYDGSMPVEQWESFSWDDVIVAKMYDYTVNSVQELDSLLPKIGVGERVKVLGNSSTGGFWTLWQFNGRDFEFVQTQRYNTQDAWSYVDWYADGYSASDTPQDVFSTPLVRDITLGHQPATLFVKVLNDGRGRWMWTQYVDGIWTVVAKQNGTIKLNDSVWANTGNYLDDSTYQPTAMANLVANRDMGWEINALLNILRDEILTNAEINELFFSMVEYAHSEQDFIDWAFKTSFMSVTGYGDRLRQDPIAYADLTSNLLDYINEVKPYHVKVRDFVSKYRIDNEVAAVHVSDYDKPVYVDPTTGQKRVLKTSIPADLLILSSGKWTGWFDQWNMYTQGLTDNMPLVRKMNISQKYNNGVMVQVSGSLRFRIFRQGDIGAPPINGEIFQAAQGLALTAQLPSAAQNRTAIPVFVNGLRVDPDLISYNSYLASIAIASKDVTAGLYEIQSFGYGGTGSFNSTQYFNKTQATQTFYLGEVVTKSQLVLVLEGNFVSSSDFELIGNSSVMVNNITQGMLTVVILSNSNTKFNTVKATSFKGSQLIGKTFNALQPSLGENRWPLNEHFIIEVDGKRVSPEWNHNVPMSSMNKHVLLTGNIPVANLRVAFNNVQQTVADGIWKNYTLSASSHAVLLDGPATVDKIRVVDYVTNNEMVVGTLVPNPTYSASHSAMPWHRIDQTSWEQWFSQLRMNQYSVTPVGADFVLVDNRLVSLNPNSGNQMLKVQIADYEPQSLASYYWFPQNAQVIKFYDKLFWNSNVPGLMKVTEPNGDFAITDNVLSKYPNASLVTVTEFNDPVTMDIRAHTTKANNYGMFPISALGPNADSYWVTVNGKRMVNGLDYNIIEYPYFYDEFAYDIDPWDMDEYYFQGIVAGQNLGGYDGLRDYGLLSQDHQMWESLNASYKPKRYDAFQWDRHSAMIQFTNYVVSPDDIIVTTVFAADQATKATEYELFVPNSESRQPSSIAVSQNVIGKVLPTDQYVLTQGIGATDSAITIKPKLTSMYIPHVINPSGFIWVGNELIKYEATSINTQTGIITLLAVTRGMKITSAQAHTTSARVTTVTPIVANLMPL